MYASLRCAAVLAWCSLAGIGHAQDTRLSNVSVRTTAGGPDTLITGFTIGPGSAKQVLVRAVGPTLASFGVADAMSDPRLVLYEQTGTKIAENDDFNSADTVAFASVGAFQLTPGGKDAALLMTLAPGGYTVEVSGVNGSRGVTLVEVYEVTQGAARLVNLSTRARVGTGDGILIPGITVSAGSTPRRLLIRAIGPTLGGFGVPGTLADPKLSSFPARPASRPMTTGRKPAATPPGRAHSSPPILPRPARSASRLVPRTPHS